MYRITKARADACVTHHWACDCREYRFQKIEDSLMWIRFLILLKYGDSPKEIPDTFLQDILDNIDEALMGDSK
jgi:hypothetical protein